MAFERKTIPGEEQSASGPRAALWLLMLVVFLLGTLQRCLYPANAAVEQFDEGVYASNVWFTAGKLDRYPDQYLYAPPLMPALIEWAILLFGPQSPVPVLPNLIAGSLTIAAVWWLARRWFGPVAGVTAAVLCAFSDFHVAYTRTALTDPLLCLWLVAAVYCIGEGHRGMNGRWWIAGGVFTGLAWWTKYNGWLPLAIQISGVTAWLLFSARGARREVFRHVGGVAVTAVTACVVWFPAWQGLERDGGYASVMQNHRGYIVGLDGWWDSFVRQIAAHRHFDGYLSAAGVGFAVLCAAAVLVARSGSNDSPKPGASPQRGVWATALGAAILAGGLAAALGTSLLLGGLAAAGIVWRLRTPRAVAGTAGKASPKRQRPQRDPRRTLPAWLLAAWFVGLFAATPLYRAYPRLTLPWLVAAWVGTGAFVQALAVRWPSRRAGRANDSGRPRYGGAIAALLGGLALLAVFHDRVSLRRFPAWQDRGGFRRLARTIEQRLAAATRPSSAPADGSREQQLRFVIYVYGEPGLFYHLAALERAGEIPFHVAPAATPNLRAATLAGKELPTFLITGPQAQRSGTFRRQWEQARKRYEAFGKALRYEASDLVLLNEYRAREIVDPQDRPKLRIRVWLLKRQ